MKRINIEIEDEKKKQFILACTRKDSTMKKKVTEMVVDFIRSVDEE